MWVRVPPSALFLVLTGTVVYFVYVIISCSHDLIYVGITDDLDRRIKQHNSGFCKSTRQYRPFKFLLTESFPTRDAARKREKYLKSSAGREFLDTLKRVRNLSA